MTNAKKELLDKVFKFNLNDFVYLDGKNDNEWIIDNRYLYKTHKGISPLYRLRRADGASVITFLYEEEIYGTSKLDLSFDFKEYLAFKKDGYTIESFLMKKFKTINDDSNTFLKEKNIELEELFEDNFSLANIGDSIKFKAETYDDGRLTSEWKTGTSTSDYLDGSIAAQVIDETAGEKHYRVYSRYSNCADNEGIFKEEDLVNPRKEALLMKTMWDKEGETQAGDGALQD